MTQYQNKKYKYEFAQEKDGEEISKLLEKTSFDGDIQLIYSRRPNAVLSINKDSYKNAIVIGRDTETQQIKGIGICTIYKMNINNKACNIAYLGGLRIDKDASLNIIEAYNILGNFIKENKAEYTFTTILNDNIYAQKMLTKKRKSMPEYKKLSDYTVNIFGKNIKFKSKYKCKKVEKQDFQKLEKFILEESKSKIFFPKNIPELQNFYILEDENKNILATGTLWEQTDYKQLIIKHYSKRFKILKTLVTPLLKFFGYPKFPKENEIIKYQTLSFVLYKNENVLREFIKQISHFIDYDFFVYGSTKKFNNRFAPIEYKSIVYIVDWEKNINIEKFRNNDLYIECGLL